MSVKPWYLASDDIHGIPLSRYIASWYIGGGTQSYHKVQDWLRTLVINDERLTEAEVIMVTNAIINGKLELQESVKDFLAK